MLRQVRLAERRRVLRISYGIEDLRMCSLARHGALQAADHPLIDRERAERPLRLDHFVNFVLRDDAEDKAGGIAAAPLPRGAIDELVIRLVDPVLLNAAVAVLGLPFADGAGHFLD